MNEQKSEAADAATYQVLIEGVAYDWHKDTISVPEMRELGGLPTDRPIIEVNLQDNEMRVLSEDDVHRPVPLEPGKGVTKRVNFKRG